jgi:hypothetical protein
VVKENVKYSKTNLKINKTASLLTLTRTNKREIHSATLLFKTTKNPVESTSEAKSA